MEDPYCHFPLSNKNEDFGLARVEVFCGEHQTLCRFLLICDLSHSLPKEISGILRPCYVGTFLGSYSINFVDSG